MKGTWFPAAVEFSKPAFIKISLIRKGLGRTLALFTVVGVFEYSFGGVFEIC